MNKHQQYRTLLAALHSEQFVSGLQLSALIGTTRAVVHRRLKELQSFGVDINAIAGRGYRLLHSDILLPDITQQVPGEVHYCHHLLTSSTNEDAFHRLQLSSKPVVVTTEYQMTGRGRRGQPWLSPFGANLMFSFGAWLPQQDVFRPFSLQVGLLLAQTLSSMFSVPCQLKWPNDLWLDDQKCAGILVELQSFQGHTALIIGIGLNVNAAPTGVTQPVTTLSHHLNRRLHRAPILIELVHRLHHWVKQDFSVPSLAAWAEYDALVGRRVWIVQGERRWSGTAQGVNSVGALLVSTEQGLVEVTGGEVSVRLQ